MIFFTHLLGKPNIDFFGFLDNKMEKQ